jgi:hypothetical protein
MTPPRRNACQPSLRNSSSYSHTHVVRTPAIEPTMKPSHVFPGETVGLILCRPAMRPPTYANVSATKTVRRTANRAR